MASADSIGTEVSLGWFAEGCKGGTIAREGGLGAFTFLGFRR